MKVDALTEEQARSGRHGSARQGEGRAADRGAAPWGKEVVSGDEANPRSVTRLSDLAQLSGCSASTISRALRDDPRINEATKSRIWQLAHDYGFPVGKYLGIRPSGHGQIHIAIPRLPTRTSSLKEPFLLELLAHIGDEARTYDCDLVLSAIAPTGSEDLDAFFRSTANGSAIVLGQGLLHDDLNRAAERWRNFVVWGARVDDQKYCSVGSDNFGGGHKAATHLARMGHRDLLFLGDVLGPEMSQRYNGFIKGAKEAGVRTSHAECRLDVDAASAAIEAVIASGRRFDGIFCVNDVSAIGAINTLTAHNRAIPGDVCIVGYDDIEYCRFIRPRLSTISQNSIRAARMLVAKAMERNLSVADSEYLPTELILRET